MSSAPGKIVEDALPAYDALLSNFHVAYERELTAIVQALPIGPDARVLDLACGDGFYTTRIAARLGPKGSATGVDTNAAYLKAARKCAANFAGVARIEFVEASFDRMPFPDNSFDVVWCAQSLYSLPDPVSALTHMYRVLRPGGLVAVLENDTLHQVLLPWPASIELPLRAAELRAFQESSERVSKYYVGRRLPEVLAKAGFVPGPMTTHAFDRQSPLGTAERALLQSYLDDVLTRVEGYLAEPRLSELRKLIDPNSATHLLALPQLTMTWVNVLAIGLKAK